MLLRQRLFGVFFVFAVFCVACTDASKTIQSESDEGMVFRRGNGADPGSLDPHKSSDNYAADILRDMYEGLVGETVDSILIPGGAASWTISEDGREYVFALRKDAKWSNGDPVVAEDFVNGFRRAVDPNTASAYAQLLAPIKNAQAIIAGNMPVEDLGVQATDEHSLIIRLESPTPYFIGLLTLSATYPIHSPSLAEHGDRFTRPGNLVSNGPYKLVESVAQSHLKLVRNPEYWDNDSVSIDTVYYYNTEDRTGELNRYRAGELDYTREIPSTQYAWIKENLPGELKVAPYLNMYYLMFDVGEVPFKDNLALRQALSMVVDREVMVREVTGLGQVPAYGLVPPGVSGHTLYEYPWKKLSMVDRIAQAKSLYQQAGYSESKPLKIELLYNTSENHKRLVVAVAAMWKQALGVETVLKNQEWKVFLDTRRNSQAWDVIRFSWVGDYNDPNTFLEIFASYHGQNISGYASTAYDTLLAAAAKETNPEQRIDLLSRAEDQFMSDYAIVPIYYYVSKHLVKPYVKGYQSNVMNRNQTRHYLVER